MNDFIFENKDLKDETLNFQFFVSGGKVYANVHVSHDSKQSHAVIGVPMSVLSEVQKAGEEYLAIHVEKLAEQNRNLKSTLKEANKK